MPWTALAALVLVAGCSAGPGSPASAPSSAAPEASPPSAAAPSVECSDDAVESAVCRFVTAVQAGDTTGLSAAERQVAATVDDLPDGAPEIDSCELVGDVTVTCTVVFAGSDAPVGFSVVPVNAEYDDGALLTEDGEAVRYEVVELLD